MNKKKEDKEEETDSEEDKEEEPVEEPDKLKKPLPLLKKPLYNKKNDQFLIPEKINFFI